MQRVHAKSNGIVTKAESLRDNVIESVKEKVESVKERIEKARDFNPQRREGKVATAIESQTARIPSDVFLWTSLGALAASLTLKVLKKDHIALFVGQWAAPFLIMGLYNKLVKVGGHDQKKSLRAAKARR